MNPLMKLFVGTHVRLYRLSGGKVGGSIAGGRLLLLTTTGKKTGKSRTVPLMFIEDDQSRPVIAASFGGAPADPAWFSNIKNSPSVRYQIGDREVQATAEILPGPERDRMWGILKSKYPNYGEYEKKTSRVIPMVALRAG